MLDRIDCLKMRREYFRQTRNAIERAVAPLPAALSPPRRRSRSPHVHRYRCHAQSGDELKAALSHRFGRLRPPRWVASGPSKARRNDQSSQASLSDPRSSMPLGAIEVIP
jgi:hypothetical protein